MDTSQLEAAIRENTSVQDPAPIAATVRILTHASTRKLDFDSKHLVLSLPAAQPSASIASYLYRLAKQAQDEAYSRACSSMLVGESSESDDTGDVAFWLGEGDYENADNVLQALGLSGVDGPSQVAITSKLDDTITNKFSFRVRGEDSRVIIFLVGRIEGGWGGLAGVGTWS